jgi:predicted RNA binding protein YcfA (HicA-like mRNA interferase family)
MTIRVGKLCKVLEKHYGVTVTKPTRGSHWKLTRAGCRPYTLPAPKGDKSQVSPHYLRAMCRQLGINETQLASHL